MREEWVGLTASDGNELAGFAVHPEKEPQAALVVVQEIFGVNENIQRATRDWASHGFLAIAPAMFDRFEKDVKLGYDEAGWAEAMRLREQFAPDFAPQVLDLQAAVSWVRSQTEKPAGVVGYCFGGTMAWLAATRLEVQAAVGYYGGAIAKFVHEEPQCPVMLHFGGLDEHIPAETREKILEAHPEVPLFIYDDASHAFDRKSDPKAYVADAATLANKRSLLFFQQHLIF